MLNRLMISRLVSLLFIVVFLTVSCRKSPTATSLPSGEPTSPTLEKGSSIPLLTSTPTVGTATHPPAEASGGSAQVPAETVVPLPGCSTSPFNPIGVSPDHKLIYILTSSGLLVFDLQTLQQVNFIQASKAVYKASISPDHETLAWALEDHSIELVRLADGALLHSFSAHADRIDALKFNSTGDRLVSGSYDTWVILWETGGVQLAEFMPGGGEVFGLGVLARRTAGCGDHL